MYVCERKSACDKGEVKTIVNGYEREGGLYLEHVCEKDTSGESV